MSEKNAYKNFRAHIICGTDRIERVENMIGEGTPDINYCIYGNEGWIEIKSPTEPVRSSTPLFGSNHKVSQAQLNWFLRQQSAIGLAFLLIETNKRCMLIPGSNVQLVNGLTVEELMKIALWHATRPIRNKAHWVALREALKCQY